MHAGVHSSAVTIGALTVHVVGFVRELAVLNVHHLFGVGYSMISLFFFNDIWVIFWRFLNNYIKQQLSSLHEVLKREFCYLASHSFELCSLHLRKLLDKVFLSWIFILTHEGIEFLFWTNAQCIIVLMAVVWASVATICSFVFNALLFIRSGL